VRGLPIFDLRFPNCAFDPTSGSNTDSNDREAQIDNRKLAIETFCSDSGPDAENERAICQIAVSGSDASSFRDAAIQAASRGFSCCE
jgi:hypothetical protein